MQLGPPPRYAHLDGLRGIAALNVMVSHFIVAFDFAVYTGNPAHSHGEWELPMSVWPFLFPVAGANTSVCIFLVLSGFVLAHVFARTSLGGLALAGKRVLRLGLPIFVVTMLAWLTLAHGLAQNQAAASLTRSSWLSLQLFHPASFVGALYEGTLGSLIGPWDSTTSYDSSLWTMSVEFAGSIVLIAFYRMGGPWLRSRWASAVLLVLLGSFIYPLYIALIVFGAAIQVMAPNRLIPVFTQRRAVLPIGLAILALFIGTIPYSAVRGPAWSRLAAIMPAKGFFSVWEGLTSPGLSMMDPTAICHGVAAVLLLVAIECSPPLQLILCSRPCLFLGKISFPLYLIHVPVLTSVGCGAFIIAHSLGAPYPVAVTISILPYTLLAIGLAMLALRFVERPAIAGASIAGSIIQLALDRLWAQVVRKTRHPLN